jgi:hypothetical protein
MKTFKELADIGAAAAFADNKRYHYMSVSKQSHSWQADEPARQAFAQAVKDAVMEDLVTNQISSPSKPWTLPPPPEGQQWHRTDWTEEMLPEGYRPLLLNEQPLDGDEVFKSPAWFKQEIWELEYVAASDHYHERTRRPLPTPAGPYAALKEARDAGKVIQIKTLDDTWIDTPYPTFSYPSNQYRIKPEPVLVPLDINDIRPSDAFRLRDAGPQICVLRYACESYITINSSNGFTHVRYSTLAANYLRRQHGETEWKPCTKEAKQ